MQNIPKILLKTYLRRQPIHLRLSRFNFLTRYSWLTNLLADLKPEFFPELEADEQTKDFEQSVEKADSQALQLIGRRLQGTQGWYEVAHWLKKRGQGHLFSGIRLDTKASVVIKEYLLPAGQFSADEIVQKQTDFRDFGGFQYLDDRIRDIRAIRPIESIVDAGNYDKALSESSEAKRFYVVTDSYDACPTLHQKLIGKMAEDKRAFAPAQVRSMLLQILQTLSVLHQQKILLPSGQIQLGITHGNLTLESILWVEGKGHSFLYLSDFALWDHIVSSHNRSYLSTINRMGKFSESIAQDLRAVGQIGHCLLAGQTSQHQAGDNAYAALDPLLYGFIQQLLETEGVSFTTAEAAWKALLGLPVPLLSLVDSAERGTVDGLSDKKKKPALSRAALAGLGVAALALIGGFVWLFAPKAQGQLDDSTALAACCFSEIDAIPPGDFTYAAITDDTWQAVLQQQSLGKRGRSIRSALRPVLSENSTSLRGYEAVVNSQMEAIAQVKAGEVDFAVLPLWDRSIVPIEMGVQTIAYDGLAAVVPFGYAEREKGLPVPLSGKISLASLKKIYTDSQALYSDGDRNWRGIGGPDLKLRAYLAESSDVIPVLNEMILESATFDDSLKEKVVEPPNNDSPEEKVVAELPTFKLLRALISNFEIKNQSGGVGLIPLSQIVGQCSVYPLAISASGQSAVQPWQLASGRPITPSTDLCNRKGHYRPNIGAFRDSAYPLAYPISVVYLQDNSRLPIGPKFSELMQTDEGQHLLSEAGLVPLREISTQNISPQAARAPEATQP